MPLYQPGRTIDFHAACQRSAWWFPAPFAPMTVSSPSAHSPKSRSNAHASTHLQYMAASNASAEDLHKSPSLVNRCRCCCSCCCLDTKNRSEPYTHSGIPHALPVNHIFGGHSLSTNNVQGIVNHVIVHRHQPYHRSSSESPASSSSSPLPPKTTPPAPTANLQ